MLVTASLHTILVVALVLKPLVHWLIWLLRRTHLLKVSYQDMWYGSGVLATASLQAILGEAPVLKPLLHWLMWLLRQIHLLKVSYQVVWGWGASNGKPPYNPGSGSGSEAFGALVDLATKANPLTKGELSGYVVWGWGASNSKSPGNPGSSSDSEAFAALVHVASKANPPLMVSYRDMWYGGRVLTAKSPGNHPLTIGKLLFVCLKWPKMERVSRSIFAIYKSVFSN